MTHGSSQDQDQLRLLINMRDDIIAHARAQAPRECCGVIVGPPGEPRQLHRLTNTYQGIDFYEPDATELYRLYMDADQRGWEILVIYHSHPVSPAYPSPRDVQHAGWPDSVYVICSLQQPHKPDLRAFRIVDERIAEVAIDWA
jgi:[CysO sulfur-carrier protein]-S-L-cysteine hydrolase